MIYKNPNFLRDHAENPFAVKGVEYVNGKCVVRVARMSGEYWMPEQYSYDASEIPEKELAKVWTPANTHE